MRSLGIAAATLNSTTDDFRSDEAWRLLDEWPAPPPLRLARARRQRGLRRAPPAGRRPPPRHRRGPLRVAMGPRLPARIPPARPRPRDARRRPRRRPHRHRRQRHQGRCRRAALRQAAAHLHPQLRSAEPRSPLRAEGQAARRRSRISSPVTDTRAASSTPPRATAPSASPSTMPGRASARSPITPASTRPCAATTRTSFSARTAS